MRISLFSNSGRIFVSGSSRPIRPFSMHWRSAMLVMSLVALASLTTALSSRGGESGDSELYPATLL